MCVDCSLLFCSSFRSVYIQNLNPSVSVTLLLIKFRNFPAFLVPFPFFFICFISWILIGSCAWNTNAVCLSSDHCYNVRSVLMKLFSYGPPAPDSNRSHMTLELLTPEQMLLLQASPRLSLCHQVSPRSSPRILTALMMTLLTVLSLPPGFTDVFFSSPGLMTSCSFTLPPWSAKDVILSPDSSEDTNDISCAFRRVLCHLNLPHTLLSSGSNTHVSSVFYFD